MHWRYPRTVGEQGWTKRVRVLGEGFQALGQRGVQERTNQPTGTSLYRLTAVCVIYWMQGSLVHHRDESAERHRTARRVPNSGNGA